MESTQAGSRKTLAEPIVMEWYTRLAMNPSFEDNLFSAIRIVEQEAGRAKDQAEKQLLSQAYEAMRQAYKMRAERSGEPPLGWANQKGGWSSE